MIESAGGSVSPQKPEQSLDSASSSRGALIRGRITPVAAIFGRSDADGCEAWERLEILRPGQAFEAVACQSFVHFAQNSTASSCASK